MRIMPALFFIAVGIFVTYRFPEYADSVYQYLKIGWDWLVMQVESLK